MTCVPARASIEATSPLRVDETDYIWTTMLHPNILASPTLAPWNNCPSEGFKLGNKLEAPTWG
jgi:hypothetical protein